MPSWWGKSKAKKKATKESFIDSLHRKFKSPAEAKSPSKSGGSRRHNNEIASEKGSQSQAQSRSSSPSKNVSRCQSFAEKALAQPLPLPGLPPASVVRADSGISQSAKPRVEKGSKSSLFLPLPKPACIRHRLDPADADGELVFASISSECSVESDDPTDSRQRSPLAFDYETGNRTPLGSPPRYANAEVHLNVMYSQMDCNCLSILLFS